MFSSRWAWKAKRLLGMGAINLSPGSDEQFAFITPCRDPAFTLWATREEAESVAKQVQVCGGGCEGSNQHYVYDLGELKNKNRARS